MEATTTIHQPSARTRLVSLAAPPAIGVWALGFAPVVYLALKGGGYDQVVYSQVGLAAWWIVLLGALVGVLPAVRVGRLGWTALGLLVAFGLWTLLGTGWSQSVERSVGEVGRVASYTGFFALGLAVMHSGRARHLVDGLACAFGLVALLAVLSRLQPAWFPHDQVQQFFPGSTERLNYPLNYANGTGSFIAMGLPLMLAVATRARTLVGQALATATLPLMVLCIVLTVSRGGAFTAVVGVLVFLALAPDRLPKLATVLLVATGSSILVAALLERTALRNGLANSTAIDQRGQLALLVMAVCAGVALMQVAIALVTRYVTRPSWMAPSGHRAAAITLSVAALGATVAIAAGVPSQLAHQWDQFKQPNVSLSAGNVYSRFGTVTGSHRYQYWAAAVKGFRAQPLHGIGPGTFQFYWAQHNSVSEYVVNAHSLYLETLNELGVVGGVLMLSFVLTLLLCGAYRTLRAPPALRHTMAAAVGGLAAFAAAAGYDWVWQLAVVPIVALLLGAAVLGGGAVRGPRSIARRRLHRVVLVLTALVALPAIVIPMASTSAVRSSQADVRRGELVSALRDATNAQDLEPYAATPRLQRALVLEQLGKLQAAELVIAQATAREPTNWSVWLVRSRIDVEAGDPRGALADYRRARALNPTSPIFAR